MGTRIEDQQIGCLWQGDNILSLSVSGNINYLDRNNPDKPLRILTVSWLCGRGLFYKIIYMYISSSNCELNIGYVNPSYPDVKLAGTSVYQARNDKKEHEKHFLNINKCI